jgi:ABC-2 type transport system ATP-binding protein
MSNTGWLTVRASPGRSTLVSASASRGNVAATIANVLLGRGFAESRDLGRVQIDRQHHRQIAPIQGQDGGKLLAAAAVSRHRSRRSAGRKSVQHRGSNPVNTDNPHTEPMTSTNTQRGLGLPSGGPGPLAVELRGVHKSFGPVNAVDGIDLSIASGEIVAFLGPNGAGKTSTIEVILGLSRPTSGAVSVLGMSPHQAISRGLVSAVLQSGGLLKDLTVEETARYTASLFTQPRPVGEVLERAGIGAIADRKVGKCSGGEQQRLRFAMALLSDPELLILDEPTTGMDVEGRRSFWSAIRQDADQGRTVLFATHYLEEADDYADRIVLVRHGRIVADGTAAQIKAMAAGRTVRATLPGADRAALSGVEGFDQVEVNGDTVLIHTSRSDVVARHLLTATAAHDLEITARGLEDAFIALTSDDSANPAVGVS